MGTSLATYRKKRNFGKTAEPKGNLRKSHGKRQVFVVQKHDASRLHYDFRLEINGVLKSWAVPKGPSVNPADKRLAVGVEDHPLEYGSFEGTIPQGEYGGGTVMLWDRGTFENMGSDELEEAYESGHIKVFLHGEKLNGLFALNRLKDGKNWLLIKMRDVFASDKAITATKPNSVKTGRSLYQIAKAAND